MKLKCKRCGGNIEVCLSDIMNNVICETCKQLHERDYVFVGFILSEFEEGHKIALYNCAETLDMTFNKKFIYKMLKEGIKHLQEETGRDMYLPQDLFSAKYESESYPVGILCNTTYVNENCNIKELAKDVKDELIKGISRNGFNGRI